MKQLGRFTKFISVASLIALFLTMSAHAAAGTKIVGLEYVEDTIKLYITNTSTAADIQASVGQYPAAVESIQSLEEGQASVKTLILVENSAAISEDSRKQAQSRLHELFSSGSEEEVFALAAVGRDVTMLQDYTRDSGALDQALSSVQYESEAPSAADALYRFLSEHTEDSGASNLFRVVFLSTGGKENVSGYTQEELQSLLEANPVAIFALGAWNDERDNGPELSSLFTLARSTGGDGWMLDDFSDGMLAQELEGALDDTMIIAVRAPEQAMDGSSQTLSLQFSGKSGTRSVHLDGVRFTAIAAKNNGAPAENDGPDDGTAPAEDASSTEDIEAAEGTALAESEDSASTEKTDTSGSGSGSIQTVLLIAAGGVIAVLAVYIIVKNNPNLGKKDDAYKKAKKGGQTVNERNPAPVKRVIEETLIDPEEIGEDDKYEEDKKAARDPDETLMISENIKICLTDTRNPAVTVVKELDKVLIIGRGDMSDIVIHEDTISRKHCGIVREGEKYFVINYSGSNGTEVGDVKTKEIGKRLPLCPGDEIVMGDVTFTFSVIKGEER